ncbi:MAG: hypothetical protein KDC95_08490 [Planctomycetes bacterium]|nr:hypothetical protein [Planctomycetota bacterium]
MHRNISLALLSLIALLATSCASTHVDTQAQAFVESLAKTHPNVTRLTVHAIPKGGSSHYAIASTSASKRGTASDEEDLRAMATGEVIVLDEPGAIDVTVPIREKNGKFHASAGITIDSKVGRDAAIAEAKMIAQAIDRDLLGMAMDH